MPHQVVLDMGSLTWGVAASSVATMTNVGEVRVYAPPSRTGHGLAHVGCGGVERGHHDQRGRGACVCPTKSYWTWARSRGVWRRRSRAGCCRRRAKPQLTTLRNVCIAVCMVQVPAFFTFVSEAEGAPVRPSWLTLHPLAGSVPRGGAAAVTATVRSQRNYLVPSRLIGRSSWFIWPSSWFHL
jgi:hypothetical protein